jgi:hypothetical protein
MYVFPIMHTFPSINYPSPAGLKLRSLQCFWLPPKTSEVPLPAPAHNVDVEVAYSPDTSIPHGREKYRPTRNPADSLSVVSLRFVLICSGGKKKPEILIRLLRFTIHFWARMRPEQLVLTSLRPEPSFALRRRSQNKILVVLCTLVSFPCRFVQSGVMYVVS